MLDNIKKELNYKIRGIDNYIVGITTLLNLLTDDEKEIYADKLEVIKTATKDLRQIVNK